MVLLNDILQFLTRNVEASNALTVDALIRFVTYAARIRNDILLPQPADHSPSLPPRNLPQTSRAFLAGSCGISANVVDQCWAALKDTIWSTEGFAKHGLVDEAMFTLHGHQYGILPDALYPPLHFCTNAGCTRTEKGLSLKKAQQRQVALYTLNRGACPAWSIHFYCEVCKINYHHNFFVKNNQRFYYGGVPDIIQVGEHQFVERTVIELWISSMVLAWNSATNCARLYNSTLSRSREPPPGWSFGFSLTSTHVYNGFIIVCLLEDLTDRNQMLSVPHGGLDADRYRGVMQIRNQRIRLYGQPVIGHYCTLCTRFMDQGTRKVSVIVVDGITLGHPCCSDPNCHEPLLSNRDRFCGKHKLEGLGSICAIVGCTLPVVPDTKTCQDATHQAVERVHKERGQSHFQLQERLERARIAHPEDSLGEPVTELAELADLDEEHEEFELHLPVASVPSMPKLRAQFGRRRTHNEQIIVAPCGVIIARRTFFFAEAIGTVAEMIRETYRVPGSMPDHIFFDNNCQLAKHVRGDPDFAGVGLSVDVFHFKSKHKLTDTFCQQHCNPVSFPELKGEGTKAWYFNSSVAEQTNAWLGGYHSICREMLIDKYNFFLDEMILRRNRITLAKLEQSGKTPNTFSFH